LGVSRVKDFCPRRNFATFTQDSAKDSTRLHPLIKDFAAFLGRSPDTASFEDV
jgi:hypothetical protein